MRTENKRYVFSSPHQYTVRSVAKNIRSLLLRPVYRALLLIARGENKTYQYEVSICAIFKNEGPYLREWIEYHRLIGVQHFYLYNNNSEDAYREILKPYVKEGLVTLTEFPEQHAQLRAYADCIKLRRDESHWLAFIDLDEFIVPVTCDTIGEALARFRNRPTVKLNWNVFGTSGKLTRDMDTLVTESFFMCWDKVDMVGKCLLNNDFRVDVSSRKNKIFHHNMWGKWRGIELPPVNCFDHICMDDMEWAGAGTFSIILNHYFTKSCREYELKSGKGDVFSKDNPHTSAYLWAHERRCIRADYTIFKYLTRLKAAMGEDEERDG